MRNSETERELTEKIKSTLDNYQEEYIQGAWENFVSIRQRQRRIIVLRIASGIAACLIAGWLGFNYFNADPYVKNDSSLVKSQNYPDTLKKDHVVKMKPLSIDKEQLPVLIADKKKTVQRTSNLSAGSVKAGSIPDNSSNGIDQLVFSKKETEGSNLSKLISPIDSLQSQPSIAVGKEDSINFKAKAKETRPFKAASGTDPDLLQKFTANDIPNREKRKIRFGINFSPGVNSTQSGSSFNYSGGLSTDINLFADLFLSTGIQLEHQSVVNNYDAAAAATVNSYGAQVYRTKADLVNLDLPVNITWKFFSGKSKSFYVSGGISSLAYLSEKYDRTTSFRQLAVVGPMADVKATSFSTVAFKSESFQTTTQKSEPSFNTFDIAGRVNLLFGVEQRLSPKLYLHLEPYIKIPVSGLATENLRFSTGGVTCKVSF